MRATRTRPSGEFLKEYTETEMFTRGRFVSLETLVKIILASSDGFSETFPKPEYRAPPTVADGARV